MSTPSMVPMFSPDGQLGDIPEDQVQSAVGRGFKIGQEMQSADGQPGVVPLDRVHDAIKSGMSMAPKLQQPKPPEMQNTTAAQDLDNTIQMLPAGLTGQPTPNMTAQDRMNFATGKAAGAVSVPVVAAATVGAAKVPDAVNASARALVPHVVNLGKWAAENPKTAKLAIELLKSSAVGGTYAAMKKVLDLFDSKPKK